MYFRDISFCLFESCTFYVVLYIVYTHCRQYLLGLLYIFNIHAYLSLFAWFPFHVLALCLLQSMCFIFLNFFLIFLKFFVPSGLVNATADQQTPPLISKRHQRFSKRQFWSVCARNIVSAENCIYQKDIAAQ